jgi:hypothetical protein
LVFVKSKNISLLHNCNNPSIMSFNVKILFILAPPIKNKHIGVLGYNYFLCIPSSNINPCSSFMIFKFFHHCGIWWFCEIFHLLKIMIFCLIHFVIEWQSKTANHIV